MKYNLYANNAKTTVSAAAMIAAGVIALTSITAMSLPAQAKGGVKDQPVPVNCSPIVSYSAVAGEYTGGYGIQANFQEQQCVSGKTRVRIAGINTSTGQTEFATPIDFDKNQVTFYGVRRATTYEIKLTIHSDKDNVLLGTQSIFVTTKE